MVSVEKTPPKVFCRTNTTSVSVLVANTKFEGATVAIETSAEMDRDGAAG